MSNVKQWTVDILCSMISANGACSWEGLDLMYIAATNLAKDIERSHTPCYVVLLVASNVNAAVEAARSFEAKHGALPGFRCVSRLVDVLGVRDASYILADDSSTPDIVAIIKHLEQHNCTELKL